MEARNIEEETGVYNTIMHGKTPSYINPYYGITYKSKMKTC